jgi:hypothetical protein
MTRGAIRTGFRKDRARRIIDRAIWDEVQTQLMSQKSGPTRGRRNVAWHYLLTGKIVDETGDGLSPTYRGSGVRSRRLYHVSRRLIEGSKRSDTGGWRLPGEHLEQTIASLVTEHLKRSGARGHEGLDNFAACPGCAQP